MKKLWERISVMSQSKLCSYIRIHTNARYIRTSCQRFTSDISRSFFWDPSCQLKTLTYSATRKSCKSGTIKGPLYASEESTKSIFKCLILDTPLWPDVMSNTSRTLKINNHEKGAMRDQPRLTCIIPTALLGSEKWQLIKGVMSLGTDFEMHAHGQGFNEEHQRPVNGVTPLLRDETLIQTILRWKLQLWRNL